MSQRPPVVRSGMSASNPVFLIVSCRPSFAATAWAASTSKPIACVRVGDVGGREVLHGRVLDVDAVDQLPAVIRLVGGGMAATDGAALALAATLAGARRGAADVLAEGLAPVHAASSAAAIARARNEFLPTFTVRLLKLRLVEIAVRRLYHAGWVTTREAQPRSGRAPVPCRASDDRHREPLHQRADPDLRPRATVRGRGGGARRPDRCGRRRGRACGADRPGRGAPRPWRTHHGSRASSTRTTTWPAPPRPSSRSTPARDRWAPSPSWSPRSPQAAQRTPPGAWIRGFGMDWTRFAEGRRPTRHDLDEAGGEHPVVILHVSGHYALVNSRGAG